MKMKKVKKVLTRDEHFGMTRYDNVDFTPSFLSGIEDVAVPDDAKHEHWKTESSPRNDILTAPIRTYVDLTHGCTLRCLTCLNGSGDAKSGIDELSTSDFVKVVEGLRADGVFDVRFTGGEPTQKQGWQDIVRAAKDIGMIVTMNSNGIINERTMRDMAELSIDEVSISVDGYRESNDRIRGKGTFDAAIRTIRGLHDAGVRTTVNSVVSRMVGVEEAKRLINTVAPYAADVDFFPFRPFGRGRGKDELMMSFVELDRFMKSVEKYKIKGTEIRTRSESLQRNAVQQGQFGLRVGGSDGTTRFNIMPNGDMYMNGCALYVPGMKSALKIGNMKQDGFTVLKAWRTNQDLDDQRLWSQQLQRRCNSCSEYKERCGGFLIDMEVYNNVRGGGKNPYCKPKVK